jgi:outer membrane protein, multidrug efflux system
VLTGRRPGELADVLAPKPMITLPEFTPVGDPREWLRRRPDVRIAERNLAAATARIGVAVADLFPKVSLLGSFGWNAADRDNIGKASAETYRYGPSISWAIFDLGHVQARISAARARADGALAVYEQTVLRALEDTEGSLVAYSRALASEAALTQAAQASAKASRLARLRFDGGIADFLEVLDAERVLLDAEDRLAQSRADSATALVAVYKALGAGWQEIESPYMPERAAAATR